MIRCAVNDRCYVGQTSSLAGHSRHSLFEAEPQALVYSVPRLKSHFGQLQKGEHPETLMQADWILYGALAFSFEVLEVVPGRACGGKAVKGSREFEWMLKKRALYNHEYRRYVMESISDRYGIQTLDRLLHGEIEALANGAP
jgi:hypothetical protein